MDGTNPISPQAGPPASAEFRPLWSRAVGLVTAPRSVFDELAARPAWFWAMLATSVVILAVTLATYTDVVYPMMLERAEQQGAASAQMAQIEGIYASLPMKLALSSWAGVLNFLVTVVVGLLLYAACTFLLGGKARVKQALAVAGHALLVHIPKSLILLPVMIVRKDPYVSLGPGVLFPPSEAEGFGGRFLAQFLNNGFDLFNLWSLGLCVLGMAVVSRLPVRQVGVTLAVGYLLLAVLGALLLALLPQ